MIVIEPTDDKIVVWEPAGSTVKWTQFLGYRVLVDGSASDSTFGTNGISEANFNNSTEARPRRLPSIPVRADSGDRQAPGVTPSIRNRPLHRAIRSMSPATALRRRGGGAFHDEYCPIRPSRRFAPRRDGQCSRVPPRAANTATATGAGGADMRSTPSTRPVCKSRRRPGVSAGFVHSCAAWCQGARFLVGLDAEEGRPHARTEVSAAKPPRVRL